MNYWQRLKFFKLNSQQRRIERYKVICIWKSINNYYPTLDLEWADQTFSRSGPNLAFKKLEGKGALLTQMNRSLKYEGVRLFNAMPEVLKTFKGDPKKFKGHLDRFLSMIPDEPDTGDLRPGGRTGNGSSSNSIQDWLRVLPTLHFEITNDST